MQAQNEKLVWLLSISKKHHERITTPKKHKCIPAFTVFISFFVFSPYTTRRYHIPNTQKHQNHTSTTTQHNTAETVVLHDALQNITKHSKIFITSDLTVELLAPVPFFFLSFSSCFFAAYGKETTGMRKSENMT
jgi:hypothetical protein